VDVCEVPPDDWPAWLCARALLAAEAAWAFFPGNAWAATSASTAVSATLPAIIQRFTRLSLRSAASRAFGGCFLVMRAVSDRWLRIR